MFLFLKVRYFYACCCPYFFTKERQKKEKCFISPLNCCFGNVMFGMKLLFFN